MKTLMSFLLVVAIIVANVNISNAQTGDTSVDAAITTAGGTFTTVTNGSLTYHHVTLPATFNADFFVLGAAKSADSGKGSGRRVSGKYEQFDVFITCEGATSPSDGTVGAQSLVRSRATGKWSFVLAEMAFEFSEWARGGFKARNAEFDEAIGDPDDEVKASQMSMGGGANSLMNMFKKDTIQKKN